MNRNVRAVLPALHSRAKSIFINQREAAITSHVF